ncbi:MAG: PadR family transcriptional regulator [Pseudolysinimonas sp.]|uniref:PadR family transcriptional regulator n=1 Tax=Pseudolysinimonas sp. TaxID=2680009 RepID=UPI00326394B6
MSSIRLFILAALADGGETHGHQLKQLAEKEHIDEWTDITVGALYGAIKRMAAEGLIEEVRVEQIGSYPERQIWGITSEGRVALTALRLEAFSEIVQRADPVDLAISRLDRHRLDEIPALLETRAANLRTLLTETDAHHRGIDQYLTPLERVVMTHRTARIRAEIAWHDDLLKKLPELLADEASRKDTPRD